MIRAWAFRTVMAAGVIVLPVLAGAVLGIVLGILELAHRAGIAVRNWRRRRQARAAGHARDRS